MRVFVRSLIPLAALLLLAGCPDNSPPNAQCGDGFIGRGETCDDGNTVGGDGCSASCVAESGGGENCADLADDDGDGLVDCDDPDCATDRACQTFEVCDNGVDDDGDGATDCDDADCATAVACLPVEDCGNGTDDDDDGDVDCDDADCVADSACTPDDEICDDGVDNDADGDIDCDDADCDEDDACGPVAEICDDGVDNDADGDIDCDDADCDDECAVCGDGVVEGEEACDGGEANSDTEPDACRTTCVAAGCGDGVVDTGEECDGTEDCLDDCTFAPYCGDGNVDEGEDCDDGDANSDTEPDACRTTCAFSGCGDGVIDAEETCDDGLENSDAIPDSCRTTCVPAFCGDGVVDMSEECDDADDNGEAAACGPTCAINVGVACADAPDFVDLDISGTGVGTGLSYTGTLAGASADHAPGVGCTVDDAATGADALFVFRPTAAGDYRVTTDRPGTTSNTVVYALDNCVGGTPGACHDGPEDGATLLLRGLEAGRQYFFVVDSIGTPGRFELYIEPVAGIAGVGEDCSGGVACEVGLLCESRDGASVCAADAAPVLTSVVSYTAASGAVTHTFTGTDPNRDVRTWEIAPVSLADGSVDEAGLVAVRDPVIRWTGDTFEFDLVINYAAFYGVRATQIGALVIDARGNRSGRVSSVIPVHTPPATGLGAGAACDIFRRLNVCDAPNTCTRNADATTTCGAPVAPRLDAAAAVRVAASEVRFTFDGADPNGDVANWRVTFYDAAGAQFGTPSVFTFTTPPTGRTTFGLSALLVGLDSTLPIRSADIVLLDAAGLESAAVRIAIPVPAPAVAGEACDQAGATVTCAAGLVCGAQGTGFVCETPEAPVATLLEASYVDLGSLEEFVLYIEGSDANGDVVEVDVEVVDPDGFAGTLTLEARFFRPNPFGREFFAITSVPIGTGGEFFSSATIVLRDSTGLESTPISDPLGAEGALGAACTADGTGGACADGLTCGAGLTCETAEPPVLTRLGVTRLDEDTVRFEIEGADVNGDVIAQRSQGFDAGGTAVTPELTLVLDDDLSGVTEFTVTSTIGGFSELGIELIRLRLLDATGLTSDALEVAIPPVIEAGGTCVGDGVTDVCADGTRCEGGTCVSSPPTITAASLERSPDNPRFMGLTVEGVDPDEDVDRVVLDLFDGTGASITGGAGVEITVADLVDPDGITYGADGSYEVTVRFNWDAASLGGIADATVVVVDSTGNATDPYAFSFTPVAGLGDGCADALCDVGLTCVADLCQVDAADPCGGIAVIDVDGEGAPCPTAASRCPSTPPAFPTCTIPTAPGTRAAAPRSCSSGRPRPTSS